MTQVTTTLSGLSSQRLSSLPALLLRLEGLVVFLGAVGMYAHLRYDGLLFAILLLAPDLGALGYLANPRLGSRTYNIVHTYIIPAALLALGVASPEATGFTLVALIWLAHIGLDRALGYGLKYPTAFKDTHLNHV